MMDMDRVNVIVSGQALFDLLLAVCANPDRAVVIMSISEEGRAFDGILAEENSFTDLPHEPGVSHCQVRYSYLPPGDWTIYRGIV